MHNPRACARNALQEHTEMIDVIVRIQMLHLTNKRAHMYVQSHACTQTIEKYFANCLCTGYRGDALLGGVTSRLLDRLLDVRARTFPDVLVLGGAGVL